ncbi:hypothetical protein [Vibrio splendidus]|uniref:hypothetical protein n=1 Tax=Vibrio splendidus TaxID=29497 RepID=UPI000E09879E|nr:hypothetical protein [Vibrio splendidus]
MTKDDGRDYIAKLIGGKLLSIVLAVLYFGGAALNNNNLLISDWGLSSVKLFVLLVLLAVLVFSALIATFGGINVERWVFKHTDPEPYKKLTKFDAILAHYTNVATVGLFIIVLTYTMKSYLYDYPRLVSFIVMIVVAFVFALYGILFFKLARRFARDESKVWLYAIIVALIFSVDSMAIQVFIASVPEVKS